MLCAPPCERARGVKRKAAEGYFANTTKTNLYARVCVMYVFSGVDDAQR